MEERKITIIPKRQEYRINMKTGQTIKKKVCAYARVSTDLEDQKNSFNAQLDEYRTRISSNPNWEFVKLYSDEGITGTSMKKREGFKKMINDAMSGKIDLILVKSISRFARNTVDCLQIIRKLRAKNVEVFFDKENISTNDTKVDIILTFFASFAQEESKSISENVKWGVRKRMIKGQRKMPTRSLIGYYEDADGTIKIDNEQAELIKRIFNMYVMGDSMTTIARSLKDEGILTKLGKEFKPADIYRILNNEKYCGDMVLQKTVVIDFLEHKAVKNDGIVDKVQITNHHEPIISKEDFMYVQAIRKYRKETYETADKSDVNMLSSLIHCEHCLRTMRKLTQHPNSEYKKYVFTCKQDKKDSVRYIDCESSKTLDYDCAISAGKAVFIKYFKMPVDFGKKINDLVSFQQQAKNLYEKQSAIQKEIDELEQKLQDLLKQQLEVDDFNRFEPEFKRIKKEIGSKKEEIKRLAAGHMEANQNMVRYNKITAFLKDNYVAPSLFKELVPLIIYRKDGSLRFVLCDKRITLAKDNLSLFTNEKPVFESEAIGKGKAIKFDVIDLRGKYHGD